MFQRKAPFKIVPNQVLRIEKEYFVFTLDMENPVDQKFQNPFQTLVFLFSDSTSSCGFQGSAWFVFEPTFTKDLKFRLLT